MTAAKLRSLDDFGTRFGGRVIRPGDPDYEAARLIDNAAIDRRPALIARARDADDIATAIHFAQTSGLPLAIRSGGHSVGGYSTGDGVLLLDLSGMTRLEIDPVRQTAWAEPGVLARQYTSEAHAAGLATPFGDNGGVGIAGITLGGGIGWLVRKHGLTIDSLLAVELVTADGRRLTATADENADLFWALRGGGGNFGVATRFQLRLHPIETILHGGILLPATQEVLRALVPIALGAPDELTVISAILQAPAIDAIPAEMHGQLVVNIGVVWAGLPEAGERALAPLRALGTPIMDTVEAMPYPGIYPEPSGEREGWTARAIFLDGLDDETIAIIERRLATPSSTEALADVRILGGQMSRIAPDATSFGWRDRTVLLWIITPFADVSAPEVARHEAWTAAFLDDLRSKGSGTYSNFMGREGPDAVRSAYPPETWARLVEIKRRYDPENLFRMNQNIPPGSGTAT